MINSEENTNNSPQLASFPDTDNIQLCSYNECPNGHRWPPVMQTASCPGCKAPIVLVKMVQCPSCNEPPSKWGFRSDHLPHGGVVTPMCKGSDSLAEVTYIEVERGHSKKTEADYKERELPGKV